MRQLDNRLTLNKMCVNLSEYKSLFPYRHLDDIYHGCAISLSLPSLKILICFFFFFFFFSRFVGLLKYKKKLKLKLKKDVQIAHLECQWLSQTELRCHPMINLLRPQHLSSHLDTLLNSLSIRNEYEFCEMMKMPLPKPVFFFLFFFKKKNLI